MKIKIIHFLAVLSTTFGCQSFLDIKPDKKMTVPATVSDCELLLNDYSTMNMGYPALGEISSDDYFLDADNWRSLTDMDERQAYIWGDDPMILQSHWRSPYQVVYRSNQILQVLDKLSAQEQENASFRKVKGGALFFRSFAFHQIAVTFALAYDEATADQELGIPLRHSPDLDVKSVRSSLKETFQQIIADLKQSSQYLPQTESLIGRPDKASAYAALARVYLDMSKYDEAYLYADSALRLHDFLLDYNTLDAGSALPVPKFNPEILFPAISQLSGPLGAYYSRVDSILYSLYDQEDLRKGIFFQENSFALGTYAYKGSYDNSTGYAFVGLTVGELYLIKAEAAVRIGQVSAARSSLNTLLAKRRISDTFEPITIADADLLLQKILNERRKELIFRGTRWADLKRLNKDPKFAKTLVRLIDGHEYRLDPNSPKYAIRIPDAVIQETGMPQNRR